jgi:hypothetical protein
VRLAVALGVSLMLLSACQPAAPIALDTGSGATSTVGSVAAATSTPALGIDLRVPPTRAPRSSPAGAAAAPSPSGAVSASPSASATVTLADDGRTVTLEPGQRALINLGDDLDWTLQVDDESIMSQVPGVTAGRGAQAMYQANRVGQTALSATGDPACRKAQPACAQPSRMFRVTIVVQ